LATLEKVTPRIPQGQGRGKVEEERMAKDGRNEQEDRMID